jgi:hypothetical protein
LSWRFFEPAAAFLVEEGNMARRFRLPFLASLSVFAQFYAHAETVHQADIPMAVVICDYVQLHPDASGVARTTASYVFKNAGIKIVWLEGCKVMPVLQSYFVVVVTHQPPADWTTQDAMGFAPIRIGDQRRAYVFLDRVTAFVKRVSPNDMRESTIGTAVGLTIAHELGHLLIPGNAHRMVGIMNPCWTSWHWLEALKGAFVFIPEQIKIMQRELKSLPSQHDSRLVVAGSPQ